VRDSVRKLWLCSRFIGWLSLASTRSISRRKMFTARGNIKMWLENWQSRLERAGSSLFVRRTEILSAAI
jgi:hypothetical protein